MHVGVGIRRGYLAVKSTLGGVPMARPQLLIENSRQPGRESLWQKLGVFKRIRSKCTSWSVWLDGVREAARVHTEGARLAPIQKQD